MLIINEKENELIYNPDTDLYELISKSDKKMMGRFAPAVIDSKDTSIVFKGSYTNMIIDVEERKNITIKRDLEINGSNLVTEQDEDTVFVYAGEKAKFLGAFLTLSVEPQSGLSVKHPNKLFITTPKIKIIDSSLKTNLNINFYEKYGKYVTVSTDKIEINGVYQKNEPRGDIFFNVKKDIVIKTGNKKYDGRTNIFNNLHNIKIEANSFKGDSFALTTSHKHGDIASEKIILKNSNLTIQGKNQINEVKMNAKTGRGVVVLENVKCDKIEVLDDTCSNISNVNSEKFSFILNKSIFKINNFNVMGFGFLEAKDQSVFGVENNDIKIENFYSDRVRGTISLFCAGGVKANNVKISGEKETQGIIHFFLNSKKIDDLYSISDFTMNCSGDRVDLLLGNISADNSILNISQTHSECGGIIKNTTLKGENRVEGAIDLYNCTIKNSSFKFNKKEISNSVIIKSEIEHNGGIIDSKIENSKLSYTDGVERLKLCNGEITNVSKISGLKIENECFVFSNKQDSLTYLNDTTCKKEACLIKKDKPMKLNSEIDF